MDLQVQWGIGEVKLSEVEELKRRELEWEYRRGKKLKIWTELGLEGCIMAKFR